jgi:hypothetical protein
MENGPDAGPLPVFRTIPEKLKDKATQADQAGNLTPRSQTRWSVLSLATAKFAAGHVAQPTAQALIFASSNRRRTSGMQRPQLGLQPMHL